MDEDETKKLNGTVLSKVYFMYQAEFQPVKESSTVQMQTIWGKTELYVKCMIPF